MKVSDYIVSFLKEQNINVIFGYQGGAITHLVNSIGEAKDIEFLQMYHEQAAAFAAEGYARVSGNLGIATATSGPGATNLITGIASAFFDSIPCMYITGQVNTYEYKESIDVRQAGFQETDIVSIVKPITKYAEMVTDPYMIRSNLEKAVDMATKGRPGPVLLDIPMNIQRTEIDEAKLSSYFDSNQDQETKDMEEAKQLEQDCKTVLHLLKESNRPVILVGGGIRNSKSEKLLNEFINKTHIPVVSTLMGLDCVPHTQEEFVGFIGAYGNRYANLTIANADLVLVLGSRLTSRQTSTDPKSFARKAKIVHVDIDKNELNRTINSFMTINSDLKLFIELLNNYADHKAFQGRYDAWYIKINSYKNQYPSYPTQQDMNQIDPNKMMKILSDMIDDKAVICGDVGQNQIWIAQSFALKKDQRLLNCGGMGAMGFALPSAIGAYMASPESTVIAIAGDGGMQINIQELQTIAREKLPIKIFVINNQALGMIRHFQEMYFESKYYGTIEGYAAPDFVKLGEAYGIASHKITNYDELYAIKDKLKDNRCYIFEIMLGKMTYVIPKLSMGRPIEDQDPIVSREELQNNMVVDD